MYVCIFHATDYVMIGYVLVVPGASIDGDNPDHMLWICERAQERAEEYGIEGVDYRLTQGIITWCTDIRFMYQITRFGEQV